MPRNTTQRTKQARSLAGIEYAGISGCTQDCLDAVIRLIQCDFHIAKVKILTCSNDHCLLLENAIGDLVAIKSGFASGYGGEGPQGFSKALALLHFHRVDIDEIEVGAELIERLDESALLTSDIEKITKADPKRPPRWFDYLTKEDSDGAFEGSIWKHLEPTIPYGIIDHRISDLVRTFWESPDDRLLSGYRRLEEIVRKRTGLTEHGAGLFSAAFLSPQPKITWENCGSGEQKGRAQLFIATYMAYRNPRAHKELSCDLNRALSELLLLNHLYVLEREGVDE